VPPKKRAKKSASSGKTLAVAHRRLDKIETHLTKLSKFMRRYNWRKQVTRKGGKGGEGVGSNPPRWPP
jgi:hypothetical protein